MREHEAAVSVAAYDAENFRERSVAEAVGSVVVTGVLVGPPMPPPLSLQVDGFTLRLIEVGAALGIEVGEDTSEVVVFGMQPPVGGADGCSVDVALAPPLCIPMPVAVSVLSFEVVKAASVPCEFAGAACSGQPCRNRTLLPSRRCWIQGV